jgi:hypothetical protein
MRPDAHRSSQWFAVPSVVVAGFAVASLALAAGAARAATNAPATFTGAYGPDPTGTATLVTATVVPERPPLRIELDLGFRSNVLQSAALEAFSSDRTLTQSALFAGYRLGSLMSGLTVGVEWNAGSASAQARGSTSSIGVDRLAVSLLGRVPIWRRLVAFGRLQPGAIRVKTTLQEASVAPVAGQGLPQELSQAKWLPAADASGGLGVRFGDVRGSSTPVFGFWLLAEVGYSYAPSYELVLAPPSDGLPHRTDAAVRLGSLSPSAVFTRFALGVTF